MQEPQAYIQVNRMHIVGGDGGGGKARPVVRGERLRSEGGSDKR